MLETEHRSDALWRSPLKDRLVGRKIEKIKQTVLWRRQLTRSPFAFAQNISKGISAPPLFSFQIPLAFLDPQDGRRRDTRNIVTFRSTLWGKRGDVWCAQEMSSHIFSPSFSRKFGSAAVDNAILLLLLLLQPTSYLLAIPQARLSGVGGRNSPKKKRYQFPSKNTQWFPFNFPKFRAKFILNNNRQNFFQCQTAHAGRAPIPATSPFPVIELKLTSPSHPPYFPFPGSFLSVNCTRCGKGGRGRMHRFHMGAIFRKKASLASHVQTFRLCLT